MDSLTEQDLDAAVAQLDAARAQKDFETADGIRSRLLAVQSVQGPFTWRVVLNTDRDKTRWHWTMGVT